MEEEPLRLNRELIERADAAINQAKHIVASDGCVVHESFPAIGVVEASRSELAGVADDGAGKPEQER